MTKTLSYIAIIGIGAFAGNMINIGLSYGMHWTMLEPLKFLETFAIDFPLLLYPTAVTLLPAFIATLVLYLKAEKGQKQKRYWLYGLIGLLIVNIQTVAYHLPLNLDFIKHNVELINVKVKLNTWLTLHWIRIIVTIVAAAYTIKGFTSSLKNE